MRKTALIIPAILLAACIAFAGCTGTCWSIFYEDDNGSSKEVRQGCTIYIELPENPTTGYSWEMDTGGLVVVDDEYIQSEGTEGMTGAGGIHKWELATDKKGTYQINAVYKRPWEETSPDDKKWAVSVNIV